MSDYSRLDRALHRLALGGRAVPAISFDIERSMVRPDLDAVRAGRHVLVSGLARAGTSVLLRLIAGGGGFAAQTYRDMPFALAPSLWRRLSRGRRRAATLAERAHGDGLEVGYDSVEAFEEVFWLTHAREAYLRADRLLPHRIDEALAEDFAAFVGLVLASRPGADRYLSKNNNNVLRLRGLAKALPGARIVIPFRDPLQQALSLRRQHLKFLERQKYDPFTRRYMSWLGHFEFGLDHRPFRFAPLSGLDPAHVDYWLDLWTSTCRGVLETAPASAQFWDYDAFCADPAAGARALAAELHLPGGLDRRLLAAIAPPRPHRTPAAVSPARLAAARAVHEALRARAAHRAAARLSPSSAPAARAARRSARR